MFAADENDWTVPERVDIDGEIMWKTVNLNNGSIQMSYEMYYAVTRDVEDGSKVKVVIHCCMDGHVRPTPKTLRMLSGKYPAIVSVTLKSLWKGGNPEFGPIPVKTVRQEPVKTDLEDGEVETLSSIMRESEVENTRSSKSKRLLFGGNR